MRIDLYEQGGYAGGGITVNGGNISGPLLLAGNPSQTLEAVPKQYVDAYYTSINANNLNSGTLSPARLPAFSGDLTSVQGSNTLTLSNTGVTPGSYPKVSVNAKGRIIAGSNITDSDIPFGIDWNKINQNSLPTTLSGYGILDGVSVNGGTMTGFLSLTQNPTANTHAANKQYVDSLLSSGGIAVGDIIRKPYSTTPAGFLRCNGAEVSKTTYADLYAVIGDQHNYNLQPGAGQPWRQQYFFNKAKFLDISDWTTAINFPTKIGQAQAIITKGYVYLIGGYTNTVSSSYQSSVYRAAINSDGTLGTWGLTNSLPYGVSMSQAITLSNRVYLLGGTDGVGSKIILSAVINSDGTLGNWSNAGTLPSPVTESCAIITKNKVYLLGGSGSINIYTTSINSDGTLGTWSTAGTLPVALSRSQAIVTKNRIYLLGGLAGTIVSTIYTAPINSDGTLGTWSTAGNIPAAICGSQAVVKNDRVFLLGGMYTGGNYVSTVYTAPINADGTLGTWTTGTSLPNVLGFSQAVVTNSRIYLIGGNDNAGNSATVYVASFLGGINDYSSYYNGTIIPTNPLNFSLPDLSSDELFGSYSYIKY